MCQDKWQSQDSNLHSLAPKPVPLTTTKCHPLYAHLILKQSGAQQSRYHSTHFTDQKMGTQRWSISCIVGTRTKSLHPPTWTLPTLLPSAGPGPQAPGAHPQQKLGV